MNKAEIGPVLAATIVSKNYRASIRSWCDYLHQHVHSQETISSAAAEHWGFPDLAGQELTWLANELNEPWLRIIDSPSSAERPPFTRYGWLSLEINVEDVDQLFENLKGSPFEIIGEPADLDVSDDIRAMQVIGLDGEVLYLTEVKAEVPPFEIPMARCFVDRLFIPVVMVADRNSALSLYKPYDNAKDYQFDTKITVINRALGFELGHRHPIATVQLAGNNMVEIDEVAGLERPAEDQAVPPAGISSVSLAVTSLPSDSPAHRLSNGPNQGCLSVSIKGESSELLELIQLA